MRIVFKWIAKLRAADETSVCFSQYTQEAESRKRHVWVGSNAFASLLCKSRGASILTLYVRRKKKERCISRMCKNPGFKEVLGWVYYESKFRLGVCDDGFSLIRCVYSSK
jgi:hypothetical protein